MNNNSKFSEFNYQHKSNKDSNIINTNTFLEAPFILFQDTNPKVINMRNEMIKNLVRTNEDNITDIETLFFSDENIEIINKQLILAVWKKSNFKYKIGFQEKNKLLIIMRYVLLEYGKNLPYNIQQQINELNCIVIGEILPNVITNFEQKIGYLRDIEKRGPLLPLPQSANKSKTLPTANKEFFK